MDQWLCRFSTLLEPHLEDAKLLIRLSCTLQYLQNMRALSSLCPSPARNIILSCQNFQFEIQPNINLYGNIFLNKVKASISNGVWVDTRLDIQLLCDSWTYKIYMLYIYIIYKYMFVDVNFDALAQASDIWIERRQVAPLCWMQDITVTV